jgi:dTDP-3-amino-3,4,6-trideoxy-alpha-D-glucose transaminase
MAGGLADGAAFSFYPSKNLGALGDAGAVCANDENFAERVRRLRDLGRLSGVSGDGDARHLLPGFNERLDAMQAAFLHVKLAHLERWNQERRRLAARYREALAGVELLEEQAGSPCIYHLFPIRTDRDALATALSAAGIATGIHYPCALPDQPTLGELEQSDAPNARDWAARELSLPLFPELQSSELDIVVDAVNGFLTRAA